MTLFERVKNLAKKNGKSIAEVEREAGLSENYLYTWKRTDNPRTATVESVAKVLHTSAEELLNKKQVSPTDQYPKRIDVEDIVNSSAMLTSRDHALSDEDRAAIRSLVETYLKSKEGQDRLRKYGGFDNNGNKTEK